MAIPSEAIYVPDGEGVKYALVGDVYTLKASGAQTDGTYALFEFFVPPGGGPPPHIHHRETEVFLVTQGQLTFELDGRTIPAPAGTFLQAPLGVQHRFSNAGNVPARAYVWVYPAGFENFIKEVAEVVPDEATPARTPIPEQIAKIVAAAPKYGLEMRMK